MPRPSNPLAPIIPVAPAGDRRPGLARPHPGSSAVFGGWGPKL